MNLEKNQWSTQSGGCASFWWKLSVKERRKHYRLIKIQLLSPFLYAKVCQDENWIEWAQKANLLGHNRSNSFDELSEDEHKNVDLIEKAFSLLEGYLSKFSGSKNPSKGFQEVLDDITVVDDKLPLKSALVELVSKDWFKSLKSEIKCDDKVKQETVVLLAAKQVCDYVKSIYNGARPSEGFSEESNLDDKGSQIEKEKGNKFFKEESFYKAIGSYTRVLYRKPYTHIVYGNRAQCYLKRGEYRSALADGRRTITLEPTWEKGQYRYAQALDGLEKYDEAIKALRNALDLCAVKDDLEKCLNRILEKRGYKPTSGINSRQVPELVSPSASDESSDNLPDITNHGDDDDDSPPLLVESSDYDDDDEDDCPPLESDDSEFDDVSDEDSEDGPPGLVSDSSSGNEDKRTHSRVPPTPKLASSNSPEKKQKIKRNVVRDAAKYAKASETSSNKSSKEKQEKKNIREKRKRPKPSRPPKEQKKLSVKDIMKQGTDALLDDKSRSAIRYYEKAVGKVLDTKEFTLSKGETVVLLYAFGTAHYEAGTLTDLMEAERQFQMIVETYEDINFPLAYYGSGRVLLKLNRHWEMRIPLNKALDLLKKYGIGEEYWPGSDILIDETKQGRLQVVINELLALSVNPPKPDAICRLNTCKQGKSYIYFSDPDFKGFVRLVCTEYCQIDYHMVCWKKVKSDVEGKTSEKDFLNSLCFTPECKGIFYLIRIYEESHGDFKTEFKADLPKKGESSIKSHVDKSARMKASSYKKQLKKEQRRKEKERRKRTAMDENDKEIERILADPNTEIRYEPYFRESTSTEDNEDSGVIPPANPLPNSVKIAEPKEFTKQNAVDPVTVDENVTALPTSFRVLKKTDEEPLPKTSQKPKVKSKKKKTKNTQSLPEFLGPANAKRLRSNLAGESRDSTGSRDGSEDRENPFPPLSELEDQHHRFEQTWRVAEGLSQSTLFTDEINENNAREHLYSLFEDLLKANGTADIESDAQIKELLALLDIHSEHLITKCGGLRNFLAKSDKFSFSKDNPNEVYLKEEQYIIDLSKRDSKRRKSIDSCSLEGEYFEPPDRRKNYTGTEEKCARCPPKPGDNVLENAKEQTGKQKLNNVVDSLEKEQIETTENGQKSSKLTKTDEANKTLKFNPHAKEFIPKSRNASFCSDDSSPRSLSVEPPETVPGPSNPTDEELRQEIENSLDTSDDIIGNSLDTGDDIIGNSNPPQESSTQKSTFILGEAFSPVVCTIGSSFASSFIPVAQSVDIPPSPLFQGSNPFNVLSSKPFTSLVSLQPAQRPTKHDIFIPSSATSPFRNGESGLPNGENAETINGNRYKIPTDKKVATKNIELDCDKDSSLSEVQSNTAIYSKDTGTQTYPVEKSVKDEKQTRDIGIMTEVVKNKYIELYESEMDERQKLLVKYDASMDKIQQQKQKLVAVKEKYEKENSALKARVEDLKKQLTKEQHLKENEQKKWQTERKELVDQVRSLKEKIDNFKEESYKKEISKQATEIKDLRVQLERERKERATECDESEDIIKKLSNCLTEHSKRAQKSEIAFVELKKDEAFHSYRKAATDTQMALRLLENHPLISNKNVQDLLKAWQLFSTNLNETIEKAKREYESVTNRLKEGKPLDSLLPLTPPEIPQPPPFPQQLLHPGAFAPGQLQASIPLVPGPRGMPGPFPKPAAGPSPARAGEIPRTAELEPVTSRLSAQPAEAAVKESLNSPRSKPQSSQDGNLSRLDPESSSAAAVQLQNKGKGSSFDKIMLRLGADFPNFTREELTDFIKEFRERRNNTLSGLRLEDIIANVSALIRDKELSKKGSVVIGDSATATPSDASSTTESGNKRGHLMSVRPKTASAPWTGKLDQSLLNLKQFGDKEPCIICHDDMLQTTPVLKLQCGHIFHAECIRRWLEEQRTCPTCRDHALLPDEFPSLN